MALIGNVLFFKKTDSLISRVIAKVTKSEFTHVGLIVSFDKSTNIATIIESDRLVRTRLSIIQLTDEHAVYSVELTDKQREDILKFAHNSIGEKYDYLLAIGILISSIFKGARQYFNNSNRLICSELIDLAYYKSGVKRKNENHIGDVTPQELIDLYGLKEIGKEA